MDIKRKPPWLRVKPFNGTQFEEVSHLLHDYGLSTVCQAANCPNRGECFNRGTATFLILGPSCTRNCRFCNIQTGKPAAVDPGEPERLARMARDLKLRHVVVTSVTRDDLADGGASQFAEVVAQIRRFLPEATVELLTPDFRGSREAAEVVIDAGPDVFNHNVETVPRLYREVRPGAAYGRSLELLSYVADRSEIITKSGIMVGLGETERELLELFDDLVGAGVKILTIGQYLAPSREHYPVVRYVPPDDFERLREAALQAGLRQVLSAPLVRSSYHADEFRKI